MIEIGVKIADSTMSWKKIYGLNRGILEEEARRYFFAADPVKLEVLGLPGPVRVERPLHPDHPELGNRVLELRDEVYLPGDDLEEGPLRLIDAVNVIYSGGELRYHSEGIDEARELGASMIHWVPADSALEAEVVMPDASRVSGFIEANASGWRLMMLSSSKGSASPAWILLMVGWYSTMPTNDFSFSRTIHLWLS